MYNTPVLTIKKNLKNEGSGTKKVDVSASLHASLIFQSILTCNMAVESS